MKTYNFLYAFAIIALFWGILNFYNSQTNAINALLLSKGQINFVEIALFKNIFETKGILYICFGITFAAAGYIISLLKSK